MTDSELGDMKEKDKKSEDDTETKSESKDEQDKEENDTPVALIERGLGYCESKDLRALQNFIPKAVDCLGTKMNQTEKELNLFESQIKLEFKDQTESIIRNQRGWIENAKSAGKVMLGIAGITGALIQIATNQEINLTMIPALSEGYSLTVSGLHEIVNHSYHNISENTKDMIKKISAEHSLKSDLTIQNMILDIEKTESTTDIKAITNIGKEKNEKLLALKEEIIIKRDGSDDPKERESLTNVITMVESSANSWNWLYIFGGIAVAIATAGVAVGAIGLIGATGAVTTGAVTTGAVTTGAVTTGAMATGAVTTGAMATGAGTNLIGGAITLAGAALTSTIKK
jgi:uncharacterized membrane protein